MENIRIQDDLYNYVNQEWLEKAVIPDDKPTTGGFADLAVGVEQLMIDDFNKMCKSNDYPNDYLKYACSLYKLVKDTKKRNKSGIKPALKNLNKIAKLTGLRQLNRNLSDFLVSGLPLPFSLSVDPNMKDTTHYYVSLSGPSVILPDVTFYKEEMKQQHDALIGLWTNMVKSLLSYTKLTEEEQNQYIADALSFDEKLASLVKSREEWSEYTKTHNPFKSTRVNTLMKPLKMKKLFEDLFGFVPEEVNVTEPRFFKSFKEVLNDDTFVLYKHWAYIKELIGSTGVLSEQIREIGSSYSRALSGIAVMPSVEKYAYYLTSEFYSEPMGLYYGDKYFGQEAKNDVIDMVSDIVETYKKRIMKNDILSDETKKKAVLKLSTMRLKMGYPDKVNALYDKLVFDDSSSLYEVVTGLIKIKKLDEYSKLSSEVDRDEWVMPGHMVNACYNPFTNDITFPAAILQPPFYSINQTRSENLGGIGAVIGHEISHAFDNNGAKYDELGNLNNWWTKEDLKKFNAKTKAMIKEFEGIELPWGKVNSSFIVSENIADNGGMAVTLDIMSTMKDASYEEYFINWAKVWCMKAKPEYLKLLLSVDVHGPAILRANMQPRNFDEWYKTFDVKKTDKMYIAPTKRVIIW